MYSVTIGVYSEYGNIQIRKISEFGYFSRSAKHREN